MRRPAGLGPARRCRKRPRARVARPYGRGMGAGDLRSIALFDGLSDAQLEQLAAAGEQVRFAPGEELFVERRPADDWWVLLEGTVSLVRRLGNEETALARMESPGQWAGGFRAWDPSGVYLATGRATSAGRMLRVPATALRELADRWFPFGVHFIRGLVGTVRNIESVARQREALVALGTLAAGFAHEINNPASAATRAARRAAGRRRGPAVLGRPARDQRGDRRPARRARGPAARDRPGGGRARPRWSSPTGRTPCRAGSRRTGSSGTGSSRRRSPRPEWTRHGASGRRRWSTASRWKPGWSGWRPR